MSTTKVSATDPVCGMSVQPSESLRSEFEGKEYFFCCENCQRKFEAAPADVLTARAEKQAAKQMEVVTLSGAESAHACCGGHGGSSTKTNKNQTDSTAIFTCPMHPEIEQVGPGDCPICGMDLEPKFVDLAEQGDDEQYADMKRRFWVGVVLSVPLLVIAMGPMVGLRVADWMIESSVWVVATGVGNASRILVRLATVGSRREIVSQHEPEHVLLDYRGNAWRLTCSAWWLFCYRARSPKRSLKTVSRRCTSKPPP